MTDLAQTYAAPKTYLWWAIGATALCFAPVGVIAIWFAVRTMSAVERGDDDRAARSSRLARRWLVATLVVGGVLEGILLVIFGLMGAFSY